MCLLYLSGDIILAGRKNRQLEVLYKEVSHFQSSHLPVTRLRRRDHNGWWRPGRFVADYKV